jgi:hypothetical protein
MIWFLRYPEYSLSIMLLLILYSSYCWRRPSQERGKPNGPAFQPEDVGEFWEFQRRLPFGGFSAEVLFPWESNLAHNDLTPATKPHGIWEVDITETSDENGWQYASGMESQLWSNSFAQFGSLVRRRKLVKSRSRKPHFAGRLTTLGVAPQHNGDAAAVAGEGGTSQPKKVDVDQPGDALNFEAFLDKWGYDINYVIATLSSLEVFFEQYKNLYSWKVEWVTRAAWVLTAALAVVTALLPSNWVVAYLVASFFMEGYYMGANKREASQTVLRDLRKAVLLTASASDTSPRELQRRVSSEDLGSMEEELRAIVDAWNPSTTLEQLQFLIDGSALVQWVYAAYDVRLDLKTLRSLRTVETLAVMLMNRGVKTLQPPPRSRVWYSYTFANFLDHVPTDETMGDCESIDYRRSS